MRAIEIKSKTDAAGNLKIDYKLGKSDSRVRVLILFEDDVTDQKEEKLWMDSISANPVFNFLNELEEDIYSLKGGKPLNG